MYRQTPAGHPAPGTQDPVSPGVGGLAGAHGRAALLKTGENLSLTSLHHHMTLQMSSVWMLCLYVLTPRYACLGIGDMHIFHFKNVYFCRLWPYCYGFLIGPP